MQESEIFALVAAESSPDKRRALLDRLCAQDAELRGRVTSLLQAHHAAGADFLESDPAEAPTILRPGNDLSGVLVGPYKLLQKIGEGGFGAVYMAEQQEPVRRKVAIKVIKPGMDSREVIARFESERQALAMMEHPNIAQVYDAGTTPGGQPYFVMELVRGVPITTFCDRNRLSVTERLRLFLSVCHAVQHAHHKGIIHRDIKPSNVMVTLHDGIPVVKVIDFGVAKATAQRLTEKTLFTAYGQMVGTPAYMSPEQAEMSGLDIDTRSDVYSLGVLLYELLTGSTPLDLNRLREAGFLQMQKLIAEQTPVRPSARVSSLGGEATILAEHRKTDTKHWTAVLRGDLDWIVMKALEKDRNRRYGTPTGLSADLDRYLRGDAIEARPPSLGYRSQQLFRKHKTLVLSGAAVFVSLIAATGIFAGLAIRALRAERDADQKRAEAEQARQDLQLSLEETRSAREKAEHLTAQTIVSRISEEFTETTLLRWAEQLPQISNSHPLYRDHLKLNLWGALQFIASFTGSEMSSGTPFASKAQIRTVQNGVLAFSRSGADLTAIDLSTGQRLLDVVQLAPGREVVDHVIVTGTTIQTRDSAGGLTGFDRSTGRPRYSLVVPAFAATDLKLEQLAENRARRVRLVPAASSDAARFLILTTDSGRLQEILLPDQSSLQVPWALSPDGTQIAAVLTNPSRIQRWSAVDGQDVGSTPLPDGATLLIQFSPSGTELYHVALEGVDDAARVAIVRRWSLPVGKLEATWTLPPGTPFSESQTLRLLFPGVLTDDKGAWLLAEPSSGKSPAEPMPAKGFNVAVDFADGDWLVSSAGEVYRRSDLSLEDPTPPRIYADPLKRFALRERYLHRSSRLIDLAVEREFPGNYWNQFEFDDVSETVLCGNPGYFQIMVPTRPERLPDEMIQALARLVAAGELDPQGRLQPWTEAEWLQKRREAMGQGWMDDRYSPHLMDYLQQPAFWWKQRVQRLTYEVARSGPSGAVATEELIAAWKELQMRDDTLSTQLAYVNWLDGHENSTPSERLSRQLALARKFGREYWWDGSDFPTDGLAFDAALSPESLREVREFQELRERFLELHPPRTGTLPLQKLKSTLTEAFVLLRTGESAAGLERLTPWLAKLPSTLPSPTPEPFTDEHASQEQAIPMLVTQVVLLGELQRWSAARTADDTLQRWLNFQSVNSSEDPSSPLQPASPPVNTTSGETPLQERLANCQLPEILISRYLTTRQQLETESPVTP